MSIFFPFIVSRLFSSWALSDFAKFSVVSQHVLLMDHKFQLLICSKMTENTDPSVTSNLIALASNVKKFFHLWMRYVPRMHIYREKVALMQAVHYLPYLQ